MDYLFGFVILDAISGSVAGIRGFQLTELNTAFAWTVFLTVAGLILFVLRLIMLSFYEANGGDQGDNFATNLLGIAFVVDVQVQVYAILPAMAFVKIATPFGLDPLNGRVITSAVWIATAIYRFDAIRSSLRHIHALRTAPAPQDT